jgi:hypothetical protein
MSGSATNGGFSAWLGRVAWDWVKLHQLRENPAIKYSWVWLALVPFLMRLIIAWQPRVAYALDVPINFIFCYAAGLCFLAAAWPYGKYCPTLVKEAPSYGAFQKHQHSEVELRNWFREVVPADGAPAEADPQLVLQYRSIIRGNTNLTAAEAAESLTGRAGHAIMDPFWATPAGTKLPDVHDFALGVAKRRRPVARAVATVAYAFGFLFLACVFAYNSYSAYQYFLHKPAPAPSMRARIEQEVKRRLTEADIAQAAALLDGRLRCGVTIPYHNGDAVGGALASDISRMLEHAGFPRPTTQSLDAYTAEIGVSIRTKNATTRRDTVVALQAALKAVGIEASLAVDPAALLEPQSEVEIHIAN